MCQHVRRSVTWGLTAEYGCYSMAVLRSEAEPLAVVLAADAAIVAVIDSVVAVAAP